MPRLLKYEKSDPGLVSQSTSGQSTDLSLKSKFHNTNSSVESSLDCPQPMSGTDSGKHIDGEDSGSDNVNSDEMSSRLRQSSEDSQKTSESEASLLLRQESGTGQQLSRANMKEHDRQWAKFSGNGKYQLDKIKQNSEGQRDRHSSNSLPEETSGTKRRKSILPIVYSSLDRSFPLPNPQQIELYSQVYDNVDLDTRSTSPQNS